MDGYWGNSLVNWRQELQLQGPQLEEPQHERLVNWIQRIITFLTDIFNEYYFLGSIDSHYNKAYAYN